MKKARKYLRISWCMTFIILIMWLIAGLEIFRFSGIDWDPRYYSCNEIQAPDGDTYMQLETFYGLGPDCYFNYGKEEITFDHIEDVDDWASCLHTSGYIPWTWDYIPTFRLGWVLLILILIQYIFLIRKTPKKTKNFALPVKENETKSRLAQRYGVTPKIHRTRFVFHPVVIYIVLGLITLIALFFAIVDCYLVLVEDHAEYLIFHTNYDRDFWIINLEFVLPSIVYLVASVISAFCIIKYMKKVKNFASRTNDVTGMSYHEKS